MSDKIKNSLNKIINFDQDSIKILLSDIIKYFKYNYFVPNELNKSIYQND